MNKCTGCGVTLQNTNSKELGFTKNITSSLCERCFRIINYNEYKEVIKQNSEFIQILKKIDSTKNLVLLVIDLLNINEYEKIIKNITNDKIVILTKRDLLPKSVKDEKLINYIKNIKNVKDVVVISSNKNYNFDSLYEKINLYKKSNDVYVVGYTNSGKSSMINKIIYNYSSNETKITTSLLPNTTVDLIKVKINDSLTLIDTPGILDDGNIINYLDKKEIKKLLPKKEIKPITYQLKKQTTLIIDNILRIDSITDSNITIFMSNLFNIERFYKTEKLNDLDPDDIATVITDIEAKLDAMSVGGLLGLWFQSLFVGLTMKALSICIMLVVYGRMIEIYLVTSIAPIPVATMVNREWGGMGQNYLKSLLALGFQAFLILVCVGIYAVLIQTIAATDDISGAIWSCMGYTVLLCFTLFKTGSLAKSVFSAH